MQPKTLIGKTAKFAINDKDFEAYWQKTMYNMKDYGMTVYESVEIAFNSGQVFLDKPYLDVSYLNIDGKLIDLDYIWDIYKNVIETMER